MYKTKGLKNSRIEIADALRGIAVMGIILFHALENFNLFYDDKSLTLPCDSTVYHVAEVVLAGKMYGIFALLFGLSFFIMRDNQEQKGNDFSLRFAWRMVLLFVIGLVNIAFYNGDILTSYAVLGLLMIPMAYLPTRWLWGVTIFILLQPVEIYLVLTGNEIPTERLWAMCDIMTEQNMHGTFIESATANLSEAFVSNQLWFLWTGRLTQTLGFFLLGILIGRHRMLYDEGDNMKIWLRYVLTPCLPAAIVGSYVDWGTWSVWAQPVVNMLVLFSEVSAVVLLWYYWKPFKKMLSNVCFFGRMSLSNYLLQSLFGSALFYGWGLGWYAVMGSTWSLLIGIGIIVVQIMILRVWNKNHERGPMESAWRKATWIGK